MKNIQILLLKYKIKVFTTSIIIEYDKMYTRIYI